MGAWAGEERPKPKIAVRLKMQRSLARKHMFSVVNATEHELDLGVQEDPNATRNMANNCSGFVRASLAGGGLGGGSQTQRAFVRRPSPELDFQPIYPGETIHILAYHDNISTVKIRGAEKNASM